MDQEIVLKTFLVQQQVPLKQIVVMLEIEQKLEQLLHQQDQHYLPELLQKVHKILEMHLLMQEQVKELTQVFLIVELF